MIKKDELATWRLGSSSILFGIWGNMTTCNTILISHDLSGGVLDFRFGHVNIEYLIWYNWWILARRCRCWVIVVYTKYNHTQSFTNIVLTTCSCSNKRCYACFFWPELLTSFLFTIHKQTKPNSFVAKFCNCFNVMGRNITNKAKFASHTFSTKSFFLYYFNMHA